MGVYTGTGPTDPTVGSKGSVTAFGVPAADAIQALASAGTAFTPSFTNVTGGAATATYTQVGKLVYISVDITAGTATAAAACSFTLPGSVSAVRPQGVFCMNVANLQAARVVTTSCTFYATAAGGNFGAGASLVSTRINGWFEIS